MVEQLFRRSRRLVARGLEPPPQAARSHPLSSNPMLVVAGEASGDALGARVVAELGVPAFGVGGSELAAAGTELVADIRNVSAMGIRAALASVPALARIIPTLVAAISARRPRAALLVAFSEINARLAPWLRRRGIRVLWYAPPQVWAWRAGRAATIARTVDRLAVVLPFERAVWRRAGADVEYVGHPALDRARAGGIGSRLRGRGPVIALLPGSRNHEVHAHLPSMLEAVDGLIDPVSSERAESRIILASSLSDGAAAWVQRRARARGVAVTTEPLEEAAAGADIAIVSSGTATLECAALGVPPVIIYRTDPVTYAVAKHWVRVPSIGLPNLLLGRRAFPELVQRGVTPARIRDAAVKLLKNPEPYRAACDEARTTLSETLGEGTPGTRVARMIEPWLS